MNGLIFKVVIIVGTIIALAGAKYLFKLPDDSKIESLTMSLIDQEAESLIQDLAKDEEWEEVDLR